MCTQLCLTLFNHLRSLYLCKIEFGDTGEGSGTLEPEENSLAGMTGALVPRKVAGSVGSIGSAGSPLSKPKR